MKTEILKAIEPCEVEAAIARSTELLSQGKVVAFPTETVYGVGARADLDNGWDDLTKVKQRPADKPFTSHVGSVDTILELVPFLNVKEMAFIRKTLPGPLTIVFELSEKQISEIQNRYPKELISRLYFNNSIGVRLPDNDLACKILDSAGGPVVASSANPAGQPPAFNADQATSYLDGSIDLIIDNGPTKIQKPSTVVKISTGKFEILREGIINKNMINKALEMNIVFVCTGNTCRSPMAEGFGRSILAKKLDCKIDQLSKKGYHVCSAGVMAIEGYQASPEAITACSDYDVDINSHRSKLLSEEMINNADCILVMSQSHYSSIVSIAPEARDKTYLLDPNGVSDPFGMAQESYNRCARQIKDAVEVFIEKIGLE